MRSDRHLYLIFVIFTFERLLLLIAVLSSFVYTLILYDLASKSKDENNLLKVFSEYFSAEAHLEPSRTSTMEPFCDFRKKNFIVDVSLVSKYDSSESQENKLTTGPGSARRQF